MTTTDVPLDNVKVEDSSYTHTMWSSRLFLVLVCSEFLVFCFA